MPVQFLANLNARAVLYNVIGKWQQYGSSPPYDFPAYRSSYQIAYCVTQYTPAGATDLLAIGSTANVWRHPKLAGIIIKSPATEPQDPRHKHNFRVEVNTLKVLGAHPRIVQ